MVFPSRCQHALGMELDAVNIIILMLQSHDATIIAHGGYIQTLWENQYGLPPMNGICQSLYA